MTDQSPPPDPKDDGQWPRGTIFLMFAFLMLLAGMWGAVYFTLLGR